MYTFPGGEIGKVAPKFSEAYEGRAGLYPIGVGPQGGYRHSEEFRTVFGADEYLHVLEGEMILANPQTGDVVKISSAWRSTFQWGVRPR